MSPSQRAVKFLKHLRTICDERRSCSQGWGLPLGTLFQKLVQNAITQSEIGLLVPQGSEVCASLGNCQWDRVRVPLLGTLLKVRILLLQSTNSVWTTEVSMRTELQQLVVLLHYHIACKDYEGASEFCYTHLDNG